MKTIFVTLAALILTGCAVDPSSLQPGDHVSYRGFGDLYPERWKVSRVDRDPYSGRLSFEIEDPREGSKILIDQSELD